MKLLILFVLVAVALAEEETYDKKYESFNVKEVIDNDRLLAAYAKCFSGADKCTPEGTDLKKLIPDAISTDCAKCTEKQKEHVATFIEALKVKLPKEYEEIIKKHDSEGKYSSKLNDFVAKYKS